MEVKKVKLEVVTTINDLPNEILLKIFSFLTQNEHYAVGLVSKRFQDLSDNTKFFYPQNISLLEITDGNVREVKEAIEMKNTMFCFKRIKLEKVRNIEDLEFILQAIGKEIEYLSIQFTEAFHLLKENLVNLKSLVLYNDFGNTALDNSVNDGSFDLSFFPLLEELSFMHTNALNNTIIKLLEQLKKPKNTSYLKHFKLEWYWKIEAYVIVSLYHHASTLESLDLHHYGLKSSQYFKNWNIPFSRMKNLKKLRLTGIHAPEILLAIFSTLPKETPLEHLELFASTYSDCKEIFNVIVKKFMNSLKYLDINELFELTDEAIMEFGNLNKLRVLKIENCPKISSKGLLAGIAKEQNIFLDELYFEYLFNLDEVSLAIIISRFPNLRFLTLSDLGKAITNASLQSIWRFSTRLRSLSIKKCSNITDDGMIGFGNEPYSINRLRYLEELKLMKCPSLTDRTLIDALKLPALRTLHLGYCRKITLNGIESLVKGCPLLEILSLPSDLFTNDNVLVIIGNGLKHLRQLFIAGYALTEKKRNHIKEVFTALKASTFSPACQLKLQPMW